MKAARLQVMANHLAHWLVALFGFVLTLWTFYPGYMSYDSAYQWLQSRHGTLNTLHPPIMAMLWQLTDRVLPGPGGMLVVQSALYWGALAMLMGALPLGAVGRALGIFFIGFWPPLFGLLPHIWKDVPMMAVFGLATALLCIELERPSRSFQVGAVLAISVACMLRHNAIIGAVPFAAWIGIRKLPVCVGILRYRIKLAVLTLAITGFMYAVSVLPNYAPSVRRVENLWSVVALWDIAAVSLSENKLLFPEVLRDPGLSLEDLQRDFMESANAPLYDSGKLRHSLSRTYTADERQELQKAWLSLPIDHTRAYIRHRWRLAQLLFGWDRANCPDYLVFQPYLYAMPDNPPVAATSSTLQKWMQPRLDALVDTPLFAGWGYVIALLAFGLLGLTKPGQSYAALATVVAASALTYSLPLVFISGSAEFRYLGWLVLATLIAPLLLLARKRTGAQGQAGKPVSQDERLSL